jgi:NAD(P)-dependent dehydrogenase (short-subunit alcohol dehydrogenase family)
MTAPFDQQAGLVIGAGRGIGEAVAVTLADRGAALVLVDSDPGVEKVAARLRSPARVVVGEGSDADVLRHAVGIAGELGRVSTLVYGAAHQPQLPVTAMDAAEWDRTYQVAVRGAWLAAIAFAEAVRRTGAGGSITLISSMHAYKSYVGGAAYATAKAAMLGLTRSLAAELGPDQIRCNAVAPGFIAVERNRAGWEMPAARERVLVQNPLRRLGRAQDVAQAIAFLASAEAAHVNGICLRVDGGELATNPPHMVAGAVDAEAVEEQ